MPKYYFVRTWVDTAFAPKQYELCDKAENACVYATREEADSECTLMNALPVKLDLSDGMPYTVEGFTVEEPEPDKFVLSCQVPRPLKKG